MTSPNDHHDEFEAQLRQLLTAEADSARTSPEALNLIRERTEAARSASWFGLPWLRPAVAVAGAVLIAGSVIMSSPQVRDQVLDFVPVGASQEDTPSSAGGAGTDNDGEVAAPEDTSTDSVDGTTQAEEDESPEESEPAPSPEGSPSAQEEEEDVETASSCPPRDREDLGPTPTGGDGGSEDRTGGRGCEPTDEPSEPERTEEPDPGDGNGDDDEEDGASDEPSHEDEPANAF